MIRLPLRLACLISLLAVFAGGCGGSPGQKSGAPARE